MRSWRCWILLSVVAIASHSTLAALRPEARLWTRPRVEAVLRERLPLAHQNRSKQIADTLLAHCEALDFDPASILALIETESAFRPDAVSHRGAVGLMQLLPGTARYIARKIGFEASGISRQLQEPSVSLRLGIAYLAHLRERFPQEKHYLAAYYLGPTALLRILRSAPHEIVRAESYLGRIRRESLEFERRAALENHSHN